MRDSILRVIDDLETKLIRIEELKNNANAGGTNFAFFDGQALAVKYSIRELRKVSDEHGNMDG